MTEIWSLPDFTRARSVHWRAPLRGGLSNGMAVSALWALGVRPNDRTILANRHEAMAKFAEKNRLRAFLLLRFWELID
jgi:hypothetical protein